MQISIFLVVRQIPACWFFPPLCHFEGADLKEITVKSCLVLVLCGGLHASLRSSILHPLQALFKEIHPFLSKRQRSVVLLFTLLRLLCSRTLCRRGVREYLRCESKLVIRHFLVQKEGMSVEPWSTSPPCSRAAQRLQKLGLAWPQSSPPAQPPYVMPLIWCDSHDSLMLKNLKAFAVTKSPWLPQVLWQSFQDCVLMKHIFKQSELA